MLLAIDIGNTHTVIGLFKGKKLINHWRISSNMARTEDEIGALINYLFQYEGYKAAEVSGAAISSVVPDLTFIYQMMCKRYFNYDPLVINARVNLGLQVKYRDPEAVGADRLCNAVAGIEKFGKPLVVIDFGTATTFDCIDHNGDYIGGLIAPGISTSINALHLHAAKLPRVGMEFPEQLIGRTTDESIRSGIFFGMVQIVDGLITKLRHELGGETKVVATGGQAGKIAEQTQFIKQVDPNLSLEGIAAIYEKNRAAVQ